MAVSNDTIWEIRTTGNDLNGGGFVFGATGTDYSQQAAKNTVGNDISTVDAVANGTTTLTSATANFQTTIVGNVIYLQGGTGVIAAGWYQVTARASTTSITLDRTIAASVGMIMNIGGAMASLGGTGLAMGGSPTNQTIYMQAGTYTIASTTQNIATGCFNRSCTLIGYQTARGDYGTPPLLQANGVITTFTILNVNAGDFRCYNINVDGNLRTSSRAVSCTSSQTFFKCKFFNCTNNGIENGSGGTTVSFILCEVTGCTTTSPAAVLGNAAVYGCNFHDNTVSGCTYAGTTLSRCLAYNNSGASSDGFQTSNVNLEGQLVACVAYNNGRYGSNVANGTRHLNCIMEANSTAGYGSTASKTRCLFINCAGFNTANFSNISITDPSDANISIGFFTGAATFFTAAASGDFSLNASAGAVLKQAGFPGVFPAGLSTGYLDVGAVQSMSGGGGGGTPSAVINFG